MKVIIRKGGPKADEPHIFRCRFCNTIFKTDEKVDLCKNCETSFREWLSGKMTEEKMLLAAKEISEYCIKRKECSGCPFAHEGHLMPSQRSLKRGLI